MSQFATARRTMVDNQLRTTDVTDPRLLAAFGSLPREAFVPEAAKSFAYIDQAHRLSATPPAGRWLMAPSPAAKLIQLADIAASDKVLVVGAGTGYSVAVIAHLAASVVGLEEEPALAEAASGAIASLSLANASIVVGPLAAGLAAAAPFDVIVIEGAIEVLPETFAGQLAEGGRLVTIGGTGPAMQAKAYVKAGGLTGRNAFSASAKVLPGFVKAREFVF
ncbi:MAG: protein-L-isoaspartate O-methyltransferase [Ancalomicrobiaceae bacterium]|nr:protein-L-isoaspartate O-methyltransferase [Ancalomicrobiaceae bacterium]